MRLLICGGRHFDDAARIEIELSLLHAISPVSVIIHGGLPGIGVASEVWARKNNVHVIRYPANFSLGKSGDSTRDEFMLADSRADTLLIFPGGRRTAELLREASRELLRIVFATDVQPESLPLPVTLAGEGGLNPDRCTLPIDRERQLLTI